MESHLLQMRGLKHAKVYKQTMPQAVASFTDAWIETKLRNMIKLRKEVASFTDAWIETKKEIRSVYSKCVASFTDAWIETLIPGVGGFLGGSHLLQMRGLKLVFQSSGGGSNESHLLQMRGLKLRLLLLILWRICRIFYRCVD